MLLGYDQLPLIAILILALMGSALLGVFITFGGLQGQGPLADGSRLGKLQRAQTDEE
jgi:hypothetical protein